MPYLNVGEGLLFDTFCRILCCDIFAEKFDPPYLRLPGREEDKDALRRFLAADYDMDKDSPDDPGASRYLDYVDPCIANRCIFVMENYRFGLGPAIAAPGDQVVAFPGCSSPIILRPINNGRYLVVGECFIPNFMNDEALIGLLPEGWEQIFWRSEEDGRFCAAYRNLRSQEIRFSDPRFDFFPTDHTLDGVRRIYTTEMAARMG